MESYAVKKHWLHGWCVVEIAKNLVVMSPRFASGYEAIYWAINKGGISICNLDTEDVYKHF